MVSGLLQGLKTMAGMAVGTISGILSPKTPSFPTLSSLIAVPTHSQTFHLEVTLRFAASPTPSFSSTPFSVTSTAPFHGIHSLMTHLITHFRDVV